MTLFEKLIARKLPCFIVYEDAHVFAFLDIEPLTDGHTLVIPKEPAATLDALSDASAAALGKVLPRLCRAVLKVSGARAFNVLQNNGALAGQGVPHVHFHIVPKRDEADGLRVQWTSKALHDEEATAQAAAMAQAMHEDNA